MKYKVIKPFFDKNDLDTLYEVGMEIDITKKRADEILSVDKFIEKVPTTKTPSKKGA